MRSRSASNTRASQWKGRAGTRRRCTGHRPASCATSRNPSTSRWARRHIFGHDEVPGPLQGQVAGMHWDPGPFWDWDHYMELVGAPGAGEAGLPSPGNAVTITPGFTQNTPPVTSCDASGCKQLPAQPPNFVYLRSAAAPDAPLLSEPALHPDSSAGAI